MTRDHMTLDRFYPIFDHPQWLGRMLPYGVKLVQMRIKDEDEANLRAMLQDALVQCCSREARVASASSLIRICTSFTP